MAARMNLDLECDDLASSCFSQVCYDEAEEILDVTFRHGQRRRYYGVSSQRARFLMLKAPSAGRYYNQAIKGQFMTRRLSGGPAPKRKH